MIKIADIKKRFSEFLIIKDEHVIDMILASVIGNLLIDRDPLWLFVVAPSSGGKSTLAAPIASIPSVHFVDDLTPKTFLSGFKMRGKEMSLLKIIGSGVLAFSDFTSILGKDPMSKGEILSQMRLIYDGIFIKQTGTGKIEWRGKMGCVACCTPDIYTLLEAVRSAGERFIFYWLEQPTDDEIVDKQQQVNTSSKEITAIMKELYADYYEGITLWIEKNGTPELKMTDTQRTRARRAAILCVNGKTTVHTDFKSGNPDAIPNKAGVGRDAKMFDTVLHTLQVMECYEQGKKVPVQDWMIEVVEKCAYSSINRERRKIMEILVEHGGEMSASEIGSKEGLGLVKDSVEKYLMPLHAVGLIKKRTQGNRFKWFIDDQNTIDFIKRISRIVVDNTPSAAIDVEEEPKTLLEQFAIQNEAIEEEYGTAG